MTSRQAHSIAALYTPRLHRAAAAMAFIIACSLLLYGVFLLTAVSTTAKRASAEREIKTLTTELSTMQARYLAYTKEVSPERATELGFVKSRNISTVFASSPRPLTLGTE